MEPSGIKGIRLGEETHCPKCGSNVLTLRDIFLDDKGHNRFAWLCEDCGTTWKE
jgi:DNA-directed RNA polymerase subunit M/transcription elongation factor TFIIS